MTFFGTFCAGTAVPGDAPPLHDFCCQGTKDDILRMGARLRDNRALLEKRFEFPLMFMDMRRNKRSKSTRERGMTPLHVAVMLEHELCVSYLIVEGADVHATCENHDTALNIAIRTGDLSTKMIQVPLTS